MKKFTFLIFFLSYIALNAQCAMCRAVVESGGAEQAKGLNSGILYLMVIPYLLIGVLFYFFMKKRKKKDTN